MWLLAATLLLSCTADADSHVPTSDDLRDQFVQAWNGPDFEALLAEDSIAFNANQAVIEGREDVAAALHSDMETADVEGREMILETLRSGMGGNLAYHAGKWRHVYADGELTTGGAYTFTFHRDHGDDWRISWVQIDRGRWMKIRIFLKPQETGWSVLSRLLSIEQQCISPSTTNHNEENTMSRNDQDRAHIEHLVKRMIGEVWNQGNVDVLDEIASEDYTEYDPALPEKVRGREAFKQVIQLFRDPMPDLTKHIEDLYVDGNTAIVNYRATGTQTGEMMGLPPTNKKVEGRGIFIFTIEDGKITSGIDMWDQYGVLKQIGAFEEQPA